MRTRPNISSELNRWRVHKDLVRVVLFRVQPGKEVKVGRRIIKRCVVAGIPKAQYRLFRLFGAYDLAFIEDRCVLTASRLTQLGTIAGITASVEYVCYKWQALRGRQNASFQMQFLKKPLIGLCFLKINPLLTQGLGLLPELKLARFVQSERQSVQMLGTLGWSEVILVISDVSVASILHRLGENYQRLILQTTPRGGLTLAEKTFTILGHDLGLQTQRGKRELPVSIAAEVRRGGLEVHFSATCTPRAMTSLEASARSHFSLESTGDTRVTLCLGARDLDFTVPIKNIKTLKALLRRLDAFRRENQASLIRTHTELQYRVNHQGWPTLAMGRKRTVLLGLTPRQARQLVKMGPEGTSVATAIYHFNNLIANWLLLDAFSDMARSLEALKWYALQRSNKPLDVSIRNSLVTRLQYIQQAVSQRYQGAYLGVEEIPWGSSFGIQPAGIGIQRILKALESYAGESLLRFGKRWGGFVLMGRHRAPTMEHSEDILLVPYSEALDIRKHWAMSHEIMHILEHLTPEELSLSTICKSCGKAILRESERDGKMLHESITDIMEHQLSCQRSVVVYLRIVWRYLRDGLFELTSKDQLASYVIRGFAVYYSDTRRRIGRDLTREEVDVLFFRKFVTLLTRLNVDLSPLNVLDDRDQSHLKVAYNYFCDKILPYLPHVQIRVDRLKEVARRRRDAPMKVNKLIENIYRGRIIGPHDTARPDAIAWGIATKQVQRRGSGSEAVAWLLSLWHNYQVKRSGIDLRTICVD